MSKQSLLAAKAARESARAAKREELEIKALELGEKFEKEIGPEGIAFAIVDLSDLLLEPVVVKRGPSVTYKQFSNSKFGEEDVDVFVSSSVVYPGIEEYRNAANTFGAIGLRCATALSKLHGVKIGDDAKKV